MLENLVRPKGAQIEEFFVDAHGMKVIENLVCPKEAQIDEAFVDAHNMKERKRENTKKETEKERAKRDRERPLSAPRGLRSRSVLLMLTA